jgi:hypothetical protein
MTRPRVCRRSCLRRRRSCLRPGITMRESLHPDARMSA